ncbi:MAG: phosphotransferase [Pseudomonadales bacterium]
MNAVTQIEDAALTAFFERYDLGTVSEYVLAANGIENSNYFITLRDRKRTRNCVLTILEQPSNTAGRTYVELMDACERAGLPIPAVLRNRDNAAFDTLYDKPALVSQRLPGHHVVNPTRLQTAAIGRFLARYHRGTAHLASYVPAYPRNTLWLEEQLQVIAGATPFADFALVRQSCASVSAMLDRNDVKALPASVIHGDVFRDNVLFNDAGLTGVLDFHHAATGYCLFDLAVAANDWCTDSGGQLDPERTLELLRSYHRIRPLQADEIWFFPMFALYAGLVFYLSRASANVRRQNSATRVKNPAEFLHVVRERLAHSFYLDPQLLEV